MGEKSTEDVSVLTNGVSVQIVPNDDTSVVRATQELRCAHVRDSRTPHQLCDCQEARFGCDASDNSYCREYTRGTQNRTYRKQRTY